MTIFWKIIIGKVRAGAKILCLFYRYQKGGLADLTSGGER